MRPRVQLVHQAVLCLTAGVVSPVAVTGLSSGGRVTDENGDFVDDAATDGGHSGKNSRSSSTTSSAAAAETTRISSSVFVQSGGVDAEGEYTALAGDDDASVQQQKPEQAKNFLEKKEKCFDVGVGTSTKTSRAGSPRSSPKNGPVSTSGEGQKDASAATRQGNADAKTQVAAGKDTAKGKSDEEEETNAKTMLAMAGDIMEDARNRIYDTIEPYLPEDAANRVTAAFSAAKKQLGDTYMAITGTIGGSLWGNTDEEKESEKEKKPKAKPKGKCKGKAKGKAKGKPKGKPKAKPKAKGKAGAANGKPQAKVGGRAGKENGD
ncbi:unnamed protein product [Amoebophrya sp. A120]|nr:unnamed protein product [Amoebophrya sp. A120]|eukprot:GSA120T00016268001.1